MSSSRLTTCTGILFCKINYSICRMTRSITSKNETNNLNKSKI